jgi:hypothetical protein
VGVLISSVWGGSVILGGRLSLRFGVAAGFFSSSESVDSLFWSLLLFAVCVMSCFVGDVLLGVAEGPFLVLV